MRWIRNAKLVNDTKYELKYKHSQTKKNWKKKYGKNNYTKQINSNFNRAL